MALGAAGIQGIADIVPFPGSGSGNTTILGPTIYAGLPASPKRNTLADITDSQVNTWGSAVTTGGGSFEVLAWYAGSPGQWVVIGYDQPTTPPQQSPDSQPLGMP